MTPQSNFIVDIKTAFVRALKAAFDDVNYPDATIQGIHISMEYPMTAMEYPHLWVQFSLTKLQNAGIGHVSIEDGTLRREFIFEGMVRLNIVALSSKARDIYASQLVQMLAFRELDPIAAKFDEYLKDETDVRVAINKDSLVIQGQQANMGTPWGSEEIVYEDGYAFNVVGEVFSTYSVTPEVLKKIILTASADLGDDQLTTTSFEFTKKPVTPGEWQ